MYISGKPNDLHVRMHEFARNSGDLAQYAIEGSGCNLPIYLKEMLNREYNKQLLSNHGIVSLIRKF
jgi:hypothetical protein